MTPISKLLAFVMFAASAATISALSPSQAQSGRAAVVQPDNTAVRQDCCVPATKPIITGSPGWTVKPPNAAPTAAAIVVPTHQLWQTIPGSRWIGPSVNAAGGSPVGGVYIYTYHLGCLCDLPKGVQTVPALLSFHMFADDAVTVKLNNFPIASKTTGWSFRNGPPAPAADAAPAGGIPVTASSHFNTGCEDNILTFEVKNGSQGPTGLDVFGTISGYFHQPGYGAPCPCGGPRNPTENPN
jgi:hypothetical protein